VKAERPAVAGGNGNGNGRAGSSDIGSVRFMQGAPARPVVAQAAPASRGPVRFAGPRY
jgi:hypothetical protein